MSELTTTSVIHFFDTGAHRILCGARGADQRSTKYARSVTCHACVGLLSERPTQGAPAPAPASGPASP